VSVTVAVDPKFVDMSWGGNLFFFVVSFLLLNKKVLSDSFFLVEVG
jgi:hypothetical protein